MSTRFWGKKKKKIALQSCITRICVYIDEHVTSIRELTLSMVNSAKIHTMLLFRLKWGVGRLILESPVTPIVIPICHLGMDQVLPNEPPYMLKTGKKVTMNYGEPIDFSNMLAELRASKASEMEARKAITDRIQEELSRFEHYWQKHN